VIRKREPRWQSAAERARVAAELIEEAESLTETSTIASPADVARARLPPPIRVELPALGATPGARAAADPAVPAPVTPSPPAAAAAAPAARADGPGTTLGLDDALTAEPNNVALLVERAGRLAAAQHSAAAQRDYELALALEPTHGAALTGLGVLLSRRGLWTEAVPRLRRAVEVEPGRAAAWYYLGEALNRVDDLAGAQGAYERAVELEPRNPKALYGLGIVLDRLRRPDEATRMYRRSRDAAGR
jgi:Flp pilus assembly protein TadD